MAEASENAKVIPSDSEQRVVKVEKESPETVPWSSLFYTYANNTDRCMLIVGLICMLWDEVSYRLIFDRYFTCIKFYLLGRYCGQK